MTSSAFLLAGPLFGLALVQGALASGFVGLLAGAGCWLYLRPGWRRQRVLRRAGQHLRSGQWQKALDLVREQQKRPCPPSWQGRLRRVEEDCLHRAASISLGAKRYEEALDHLHQASELQGVNPDGSLKRIQGAMLQEIYRLYALQTTERVESALALCARLLAIDSSCAEAHFWQGLCRLFHGKNDEALKSLRSANELSGDGYLDPAFYLGGLLRRNGQPVEAVRHLALAQRLAPKSGFVSLELGRALMEASGEISLAVRAFERAIESLTATIANGIPGDRAWCEPMPAAHSFVHSRTGLDPFVCPLMGSDIKVLVREAKLALAGVLARARSLPDAIALYRSLLAEAPPTPPVLRGLGQALARQGNYEEAYAQLRLGSENEATADPLTNGYMALCAAKGKPPQSEDRAANVSWALRLLASIDARGNAELTGLWSAVHAEARSLGLKIPQEEQVRLCDYLASVEAIEAQAASGYRHLAASYPENLSPLHCWFYCRAVLTSKGTIENDLRLYALAFGDAEKMRAFYAEHGWDCDEVETHYLERAAAFEPGVFPAVLGRDYETRGEQLLLERSRRLESSGLEGPALASAEALLKLAPTNCSAHDRLAELCYRQGDLKRAATLLTNYHRLAPADPLPLVRRAIIEQQLGENDASSLSLSAALEIAPKSNRAGISFIGARLALTELVQHSESGQPDVDEAQVWLDSCLQEEPGHQQALWCRAALLALRGDSSALAELSATLKDDSADGRFQIMAALCALAANDYPGAKESAHRASEKDPGLALEAAYLVARAELALGNREAAGVMLEKAAASPQGNILDQVRALLGSLAFQDKNYAAAISRWERIDPEHRASWKLDEPLRSTALVAGLQDLTAGRFQQAAQRFREAGRLGSHERQLGALLILALIQEGHRLSHLDDPDQRSGGPRLLEQALKAGCRDDNVGYSLALAHKRSGQYRDARKVLERISKPDADDLLQMAVLSLADGRLAQAEQDLERARSLAPDSPELCHNLLFTRLSLGKLDGASELADRVIASAPGEEKGQLESLRALLTRQTLPSLSAESADQLLVVIRKLGNLDVMAKLIATWLEASSDSPAVREAHEDILLLLARRAVDRCDWSGAEGILVPLAEPVPQRVSVRIAASNLLGCCASMRQDYPKAVGHFKAALALADDDPRLEQNLALALEHQQDWASADAHWNRYLELVEGNLPSKPSRTDYANRLLCEALRRLATNSINAQRWSEALTYAQQLAKLRPADKENLEMLFHLYSQSGLTDEARRALRQLREERPGDLTPLGHYPGFEPESLDALDQMLDEVERLLKRHLEADIEIRAMKIIADSISILEQSCTVLSDQLARLMNEVGHMARHQVDWSAVHGTRREIQGYFARMRQLVSKGLKLARVDKHREKLAELHKTVDAGIRQSGDLTY